MSLDRPITIQTRLSHLVVALVAVPTMLFAGDLTLPNTFTNGTVADADAVNANFAAVETEVDGNAADIAALTTAVSDLQTDLAAIEAKTSRTWWQAYSLAGSQTLPLLDEAGNAMPSQWRGMVTCAVSSTNAPGASTWLVSVRPDGNTHLERVASHSSTTSNTPQLVSVGNAIHVRLYNHSSSYTVR
jgi:hypothetical protein